MTPSRPYLLRAVYQWIVDNDCTPYLLVDAEREGVHVPRQHVKDGKIILNIAPRAVQGLQCGNELIEFHARFGGQPMHIQVPVMAALAIYASENGRGMIFPDEDEDHDSGPEPGPDKPSRPQLKVVK